MRLMPLFIENCEKGINFWLNLLFSVKKKTDNPRIHMHMSTDMHIDRNDIVGVSFPRHERPIYLTFSLQSI